MVKVTLINIEQRLVISVSYCGVVHGTNCQSKSKGQEAQITSKTAQITSKTAQITSKTMSKTTI